MGLMTKVRARHIAMMERTCTIIGNLVQTITPEQAVTLRDPRDGDKGWTVLEVVSHLAEFDGYFYLRAVLMLEQVYPTLPAYDQEALAREHDYIKQDINEVYARLAESRKRFVDFFNNLSEEQWNRAGVHPEKGHFTLTDAVMNVTSHDLTHIEQITRIIAHEVARTTSAQDVV